MKDLIKWVICIIKKRHTWEYFESRKTRFHQYYKHGAGHTAICEYCGRIVFFPMKNKKEKR